MPNQPDLEADVLKFVQGSLADAQNLALKAQQFLEAHDSIEKGLHTWQAELLCECVKDSPEMDAAISAALKVAGLLKTQMTGMKEARCSLLAAYGADKEAMGIIMACNGMVEENVAQKVCTLLAHMMVLQVLLLPDVFPEQIASMKKVLSHCERELGVTRASLPKTISQRVDGLLTPAPAAGTKSRSKAGSDRGWLTQMTRALIVSCLVNAAR
jgi:hypothetical protein